MKKANIITYYSLLSKKIRESSDDRDTLNKLRLTIDRLYGCGRLIDIEFTKLDSMIVKRLINLNEATL